MATPSRDKKIRQAWSNMKKRCSYPESARDYQYYVDISYDPSWESFDNFYNDMASSYELGLTLDRIDNSKGYSKDNCRWATAKEQANNTRKNRFFIINGQSKTLEQWIDTVNIKSSTVRQRLYAYGWDIEKSLFTPARKWNRRLS